MNPENHYTERLSLTEGQLQQVKKQIFRISMLRLALFIAGIAGLYFFFNQTTLLIICICLTFLPLFILVKIHNRFFIRKEWLETQARIIQEELQAFLVITVLLRTGKNTSTQSILIHSTWIYSDDAPCSNQSTVLVLFSENRLAKWLQNHLHEKTSIEKRQEWYGK